MEIFLRKVVDKYLSSIVNTICSHDFVGDIIIIICLNIPNLSFMYKSIYTRMFIGQVRDLNRTIQSKGSNHSKKYYIIAVAICFN